MHKRQIFVHTLAAAMMLLPFIVLAHGGEDDGHVEEVVVKTTAGASALLKPFSSEWWGLLAVSSVLTAALSFGVWKYLQVPNPKASKKSPEATPKTESDEKK